MSRDARNIGGIGEVSVAAEYSPWIVAVEVGVDVARWCSRAHAAQIWSCVGVMAAKGGECEKCGYRTAVRSGVKRRVNKPRAQRRLPHVAGRVLMLWPTSIRPRRRRFSCAGCRDK